MKIKIKNKRGEGLIGILEINKDTRDLVIILHGSRGNKEGKIQKYLSKKLSKKYNIFRLDFSGNGESEGKLEDSNYSKDIEDLLNIINYFSYQDYKIKSIIGHSKSASGLLLASKKINKKVNSIIALAPRTNLLNSSEMRELKKRKKQFNQKGFYIFPSDKKQKINEKYIRDIQKFKDVSDFYSDKVPTLIIHGTKDKVINIREARDFKKEFPKIKLIEIKEGDHSFNRKLVKVEKSIIKFLKFL